MPVTALALAAPQPQLQFPRVVALYWRADWPQYETVADLAEYVGLVAASLGQRYTVLAWGRPDCPGDVVEVMPAGTERGLEC